MLQSTPTFVKLHSWRCLMEDVHHHALPKTPLWKRLCSQPTRRLPISHLRWNVSAASSSSIHGPEQKNCKQTQLQCSTMSCSTTALLNVLYFRHRFPHIIIPVITLLSTGKGMTSYKYVCLTISDKYFFFQVLMLIIPFLAGQRHTMCHSDDSSFDGLQEVTQFCVIQGKCCNCWDTGFYWQLVEKVMCVGVVFHFVMLSIHTWFCCSVFNILVAILTFSTDSIIRRHPKAFFLVEFFLATVIPGCIVTAVYNTMSYAPDAFLMYLCIPSDYDVIFYSYTVPFQIYCIVQWPCASRLYDASNRLVIHAKL